MPDTVEHNRRVSHDPKPPQATRARRVRCRRRARYWEYNDVRINQLSLALLHLFGRPLPEVFREEMLQPLGGGEGLRWVGYDDAWVDVGGRRVQSVPGGTHWGAGVSISARDQARIGQLLLDGGAPRRPPVVPAGLDRSACAAVRDRAVLRLAALAEPRRRHVRRRVARELVHGRRRRAHVWMDPAHEAVVVVRWIDPAHSAGFVERMGDSLTGR